MKIVLFTLSDASKIDFTGIDKLTKNDLVICLYVKGKKNISDDLSELLSSIKAESEFYEVAETADLYMNMAYLIGYYSGLKKDTYAVLKDKSKLPSKITKDIKVYTSFKSVASSEGSGKSTKKSTSSKSSKSTKKTSAKKSSASKTKEKDSEIDLSDILGSSDLLSGLAEVAGSILGSGNK